MMYFCNKKLIGHLMVSILFLTWGLTEAMKLRSHFACPSRECQCFATNSNRNIGLKCVKANITSTEFLHNLPQANLISSIDLTDNNITVIQNDHLSAFSNLSTLIMSKNDIEYIESSAFIKLGLLRDLDLSHNKLQILDESVFAENTHLEVLDLSHNKIQHIPKALFKHTKGLTHLHLHHNYLLCIDKQGFEGLHDLKELFLDNNNLTTFDQKTFESLGLSAKFTGHNNKLICDCNIKWITGWLAVRKRISKLTKDKPSLISCASPRNLQGRSVEKLDMDDFTCHTGPQNNDNENTINPMEDKNWEFQMDKPASMSGMQQDQMPTMGSSMDDKNSYASMMRQSAPESGASPNYCPSSRICPEKCTCMGGLVDCSNKGLDHIPYNIPDDVTELLLHTNKITHIPDYAFAELSNLTKLDICNNHISKISKNAFSGLYKLSQLSMYSNHIRDLPSEVFEYLPNLNILLLNANEIGCLRKGIFNNLKNLRLLSLFQNNIRAIEDGTLDNLKTTTNLHLGNNPLICDCNLAWIKRINGKESSGARCDYPERARGRAISSMNYDDFTCKGGEKERTLQAGSCFVDLPCPDECKCNPDGLVQCREAGLTYIPANIPQYTLHLDLSKNKINKILADGSFKNLPNLKTVDFSENNIEKIESNAFDGAVSLQSIDLKKNQLSHIEEGVLATLKNLTSLELRENHFKCVSNKTFTGLSKLRKLSLAENTIKTIEENAFDGLPLETLNLLGNHFICNCHMSWFNKWLNNQVNLAHGNPRCQEPPSLKDLPIADLNNNDLICSSVNDRNGCIHATKCPESCTCVKTTVTCTHSPNSVAKEFPIETTKLSITESYIDVFDPRDYDYLSNLEELDLSRNNIRGIVRLPPNETTRGYRKLKKLDLGHNYITCLQPESLLVFEALEELILTTNVISQIPYETFQPLAHLKKADFSENPLYCDCNMKWIASETWKDKFDRSDAKCSEPERMNGKQIERLSGNEFKCFKGEPSMFVMAKCDKCVLKPCNGGTCRLVEDGKMDFECDCNENFKGRFCEEIIDHCYSNPCTNGGVCNAMPDQDGYTCDCPDGFHGTRCEKNFDDCQDHKCKNGGSCVDGINAYTCNCGIGYSGDFCETDVDICEYGRNPCQNGGKCFDLGYDYKCTCQPGYNGKNCERKVDHCFHHDGSPYCLNKALCVQEPYGQTRCRCIDGFYGPRCENNSIQIIPTTSIEDLWPMDDACAELNCVRNQGSCKESKNGLYCACSPGFSGKSCENTISVTLSDQSSNVEALLPWQSTQNFTFEAYFHDDAAGLLLYDSFRTLSPACASCFLMAYVEEGEIGVTLKRSKDENEVTIRDNLILSDPDHFASFSIIIAEDYVSIVDLKNQRTVTKKLSASHNFENKLPDQTILTLGYNPLAKFKPETPGQSGLGCIKSLYVNSNQFFFETSISQHAVNSGLQCELGEDTRHECRSDTCKNGGQCQMDKGTAFCFCAEGYIGKDCSIPSVNTSPGNSPHIVPDIPSKCGEQRMQYVWDGDCVSVREYNVVSTCPTKCRNGGNNPLPFPVGGGNSDIQMDDDQSLLCCKVTRYRDYQIRFKCPDGSRKLTTKRILKKCECNPC